MESNVQFFDQKRVTRFKNVSRLKSVAHNRLNQFSFELIKENGVENAVKLLLR